MECKRAVELITQFINEQLNAEDTEAFLNHIDSCPECREELEVTYSLMTAMKQLDEDTELSDNYIEELNQKIETCYLDELKRKRSCARRRAVLGIAVVLLVLLNGITVNKAREEADRSFFRRIAGIEPLDVPENVMTASEMQDAAEEGSVVNEEQEESGESSGAEEKPKEESVVVPKEQKTE